MSIMTLYTYAALAAPLTQALTEVIERQMAAWGPTLDDTIAEMLVRALAANGAEGAHHRVQDRADVWVWRVQEGEDSPYVAAVEGPESARPHLSARCAAGHLRGPGRAPVSARGPCVAPHREPSCGPTVTLWCVACHAMRGDVWDDRGSTRMRPSGSAHSARASVLQVLQGLDVGTERLMALQEEAAHLHLVVRFDVPHLHKQATAEQRRLQEERKERDMLDALWVLQTLIADFGYAEVERCVLQHLKPDAPS